MCKYRKNNEEEINTFDANKIMKVLRSCLASAAAGKVE